MEKRVIIAFVLSFAVLYAFRAFFSPPTTPEPAAETSPAASSAPAPAEAPVQTSPAEAATPQGESDNQADKPDDPVYETPLYIVTGSNAGGVLKSIRLKNYGDGQGRPVELINQESGSKL